MSNTTGGYNTAIGSTSLNLNTTGSNNTAVGNGSLQQNTTGDSNTAVGYNSLVNNTTGSQNTSVGYITLGANTTGVFNTALGSGALASNTTGVSNTAIGANSLLVNTTGNNNTAIGTDSLNVNTTGSKNTAIGYYALVNNTTASNNIAIGYYALSTNSTANYNIAIGNNSLRNNVGSQNIGIGEDALLSNTIGASNTAIGFQALQDNTTGGQNFALGIGALANNTTGSGNIAIGASTLVSNTTTSNSIGIGFNALLFATGGNNIAIGNESGKSITTGANNTILGAYAGTAGMSNNIVLADGAGNVRYQWDGTNNVFTGAATFSSSVTAANIIIGNQGVNITSYGYLTQTISGQMTILGHNVKASSSVANQVNVVNGGWISSMIKQYYNEGITFHSSPTNYSSGAVYPMDTTERMRITNDGNVGIGTSSPSGKLTVNTGTNENVSILSVGSGDMRISALNDAASANVQLSIQGSPLLFRVAGGVEAMRITSGGNVGIGTNSPNRRLQVVHAAPNFAEVARFENTSNRSADDFAMVTLLGSNTSNTNSYHYIAVTGAADKMYVYGNGNIVNTNNSYGTLSDISLKENIIDATPKLADILNLKVRNFNLIGDDTKQIGFIAQEFEEVFPSMVDLDGKSGKKAIKTSVLVPMLVKAIQEQTQIIKDLEARIKQLENK